MADSWRSRRVLSPSISECCVSPSDHKVLIGDMQGHIEYFPSYYVQNPLIWGQILSFCCHFDSICSKSFFFDGLEKNYRSRDWSPCFKRASVTKNYIRENYQKNRPVDDLVIFHEFSPGRHPENHGICLCTLVSVYWYRTSQKIR